MNRFKHRYTALAALVMSSVMSFTAHADGGHGNIKFEGSVIDAACSIDAGSLDQTVQMGAITSRVLKRGGESTPVPFSIKLHDCSTAVSTSVKVAFNGTAGNKVDALDSAFATSGSARGIGVVVAELGGSVIKPNAESSSIVLNDNDNDLMFQAFVKGSDNLFGKNKATPGSFTATTNFVLNYE